ncbi:MAG: tryptophan synthase subunit alpha [Clostridium sp.]|uniref:tryptophan synthase subunit alpha n=1 Tax=Clostridium sp. TaxID=1506 RepID=UPI003F34036C
MSRIEGKFKELKLENRKALVPFITASYPNKEESIKLIKILEDEGADILELGVPYSDPLADGEVIEKSYLQAIKNGAKVEDIFYIIEESRKSVKIPIVVMTYFNVVYSYGIEKFLEKLKAVSGDGIIIPDLPLEERKEILEKCRELEIDLIPLVARTSEERIKRIVKNSSGFIYCVSVNGITGERKNIDLEIDDYLNGIKEKTDIPRLLGFGISNKETVLKVKDKVDGIIIGSAIVKRIKKEDGGYNSIKAFMKEIRGVL